MLSLIVGSGSSLPNGPRSLEYFIHHLDHEAFFGASKKMKFSNKEVEPKIKAPVMNDARKGGKGKRKASKKIAMKPIPTDESRKRSRLNAVREPTVSIRTLLKVILNSRGNDYRFIIKTNVNVILL